MHDASLSFFALLKFVSNYLAKILLLLESICLKTRLLYIAGEISSLSNASCSKVPTEAMDVSSTPTKIRRKKRETKTSLILLLHFFWVENAAFSC